MTPEKVDISLGASSTRKLLSSANLGEVDIESLLPIQRRHHHDLSELCKELKKDDSKLALVVDDDPMNVFVLDELLQKEGYKCDTSYTEDNALRIFAERLEKVKNGQAKMYKIILLDYSMPGIGGLEVAKRICQMVEVSKVQKPAMCCCTAYCSEEH